MNKHKRKKFFQVTLMSLVLCLFTTFVLFDTFLIPKKLASTTITTNQTQDISSTTTDTSVETSDNSYHSQELSIDITKKRVNETNVYIADIKTDGTQHLFSALAQDSYGKNIKETTSSMASRNNAILAINGDYYGYRDTGYVLRNGTIYRNTPSTDTDALVIDDQGDFSIVNQSNISLESIQNAYQVFSFGPTLVNNGEIVVDTNTEVQQSASSNPRTAIAQVGKNHYLIIVSEGRTSESKGLTLYELASLFKDLGATTAYNLDGGGSSTLYFNGKVLNQTVGGRGQSERSVSDIIYFS